MSCHDNKERKLSDDAENNTAVASAEVKIWQCVERISEALAVSAVA